jgi:multiple sugar transport system permease protein
LNLLESYFGLALAHSTFILPVIVWILKGFFEVFPFEIEDAAKIDGYTRLQILFKIILPLSGPALTSVIIFSFIASWNDFLFALVLTKTQARTVPLAVAEYMGFYQISYTKACASGLIAVIPTILLAMFFEKYIIKGLIRGALKA